MAENLVRLGDSPGNQCLGQQTQYFSYAVKGIGGYEGAGLGEGLEYEASDDPPHCDRISPESSCILAARVALFKSVANLIPCSGCEYADAVQKDPIVIKLRKACGL